MISWLLFCPVMKKFLTGGFLACGGVALLLTGVWFLFVNADFLRNSERAEGVVAEIVCERGVRGSKICSPMVRYRPDEQRDFVTFKARPGTWPSPFDVGDSVTVAFRPDDPGGANIVSFWTLWFLPLVAMLFGVACLFAAWDTLRRRA